MGPVTSPVQSALAEILVVDLSGSVSTTYCTKLFSDYGARVVNVEPDGGFPTRRLPPHVRSDAVDAGADILETSNCSAMHGYLNAGKQSVRRSGLPESQFTTLIQQADLVLDDGSYEECDNANLRMSISWYGDEGPYADFTGTDAQCFALNGMLRLIGHREGPPLIPTGYQAQIVGRLFR